MVIADLRGIQGLRMKRRHPWVAVYLLCRRLLRRFSAHEIPLFEKMFTQGSNVGLREQKSQSQS